MSDLREALEAAFAASESTEAADPVVEAPAEVVEPVAEVEPAAEVAQAARDDGRDDKGRFAPKEKSPEPVAAQQTAPEQVQQPLEQKPRWSSRPQAWKKEMDPHWSTLPEPVQQYIFEREGDVRRGIDKYRSSADQWQKFEEVLKPHQRTFQQMGVSPIQATQYLLNADAKLRYSPPQEKARYFSELAREYGIDLSQVTQLPAAPPEYQLMQQELNRLRQLQTRVEQERTQSLQSEIEAFAEQHEHMEAVRPAMAVLLQNGQAKDLQDAYEKAIWADPEIRQRLLEKQVAEKAKEVQDQSLRSRQQKASVSVKGSSPAAGSSKGPKDSLRAEIESAWDTHAG